MRVSSVAAVCLAVIVRPSMAIECTRGESHKAREWAAALFEAGGHEGPSAPCLRVERNNDTVQFMGRNGEPMRLGGRSFDRGLFAHADSRVVVLLPGPAERLLATVGVDSNRDTLGGRGSVTFRVVTDETLWESRLLREGDAPVQVACSLNGATEFALEVTDGGDGIACDQADWAQARVQMGDGSVVWLDELPLIDERMPGPAAASPSRSSMAGSPPRICWTRGKRSGRVAYSMMRAPSIGLRTGTR